MSPWTGKWIWKLDLLLYGSFSFTGPVPEGADAVVQIENVEQIRDTSGGLKCVKILVGATPDLNIRPVVKLYFFW